MSSALLIVILLLSNITMFVIVCVQRLTIFEQRHEVHEMKRWYDKQHQTFWDAS